MMRRPLCSIAWATHRGFDVPLILMNTDHPAGPDVRRFRLPDGQRRTVYTTLGALWLTGVLWLLGHFFMRGDGDIGPIVHPLEPWSLRLHGAVVLVFATVIGSLWPAHIRPAWIAARNRRSGLSMAAGLGLLTITGYLLYYGSAEAVRDWSATIHWTFGLATPLLLTWHVARGRPKPVLR